MSKKHAWVWTARLAALVVAAVIPACTSGGGTPGQTTSGVLWNSQAGTGSQPTPQPPPVPPNTTYWHDPNSGIGAAPPPNDPTDIRTYTSPDIYILGLHHPLMTDISSKNFPFNIIQEDTLTQLLVTYRYNQYLILIGKPLPPNATLIEFLGLRQNARAHAKHYAVWHPNIPLPLVNAEGDSVYYSNPAPGPGIEFLPDLTTVVGPVTGRLPKSFLQADEVGQLVLSGPLYQDSNAAADFLIKTYGGSNPVQFLLFQDWTHLGVGYWNNGGSTEHYYWNVIMAKNPSAIVNTPTVPFLNPLP